MKVDGLTTNTKLNKTKDVIFNKTISIAIVNAILHNLNEKNRKKLWHLPPICPVVVQCNRN